MQTQLHLVKDQHFIVSASRCLFWDEMQTLVCSDLHFGKTGHFRKSGLAIPADVFKDDLQRLFSAIQFFKPQQLLIVGDMFHSHANKEIDLFSRWRKDMGQLPIHLVLGNHDILHKDWYAGTDITLHDVQLQLNNCLFVHDAVDAKNTDCFVVSGHVHPAIVAKGMGKQSLRFPCFYFTDKQCILPAFSKFTGSYTIEPKKKDFVYAVVEQSIIAIR
jgi:uncharacterized protein